ncbi:hypothetical protein QTP88_018314 [Uroleucon formosanum]
MVVNVTCGVPQGSVVGPLLWNMRYDRVLRIQLPREVRLVGFADDTLVMVWGKTSDEVEATANSALDAVAAEIAALDLTLATEKTEAVMFKRKYKDVVPRLVLSQTQVTMKRSIKHLGIIVDDNLNFNEHVDTVARKAQKVMQALGRLMPNVGGPKESKRKLLASVVHSVILYGAPIWGPSLEYSRQRTDKLLTVQRRAMLRCICAYKTTSRVAVNIIVATPPIYLLAKERTDAYWSKKNAGTTPSRSAIRSVSIRRPRENIVPPDPTAKWTWMLWQICMQDPEGDQQRMPSLWDS